MSKDSYVARRDSFIILLGAGFAYAGSDGRPFADGLHLFALVTFLAFAIQWVAFVPAIINQTEHFFDLVGALTFIAVAALAYVVSGHHDLYATVAMALVVVWAIRIGTFLFRARPNGWQRPEVRRGEDVVFAIFIGMDTARFLDHFHVGCSDCRNPRAATPGVWARGGRRSGGLGRRLHLRGGG